MTTNWQEHPDLPDMYYRREGRTVHLAGRAVVEARGEDLPHAFVPTVAQFHYGDVEMNDCAVCGGDDDHPIHATRNQPAEHDRLRAAYTDALQSFVHYSAEAPQPRRHPVIHVSAEASAPSKRMTLAELAAFVEQARTAGVPDTAGLAVSTKGLGHLRKITTEDAPE